MAVPPPMAAIDPSRSGFVLTTKTCRLMPCSCHSFCGLGARSVTSAIIVADLYQWLMDGQGFSELEMEAGQLRASVVRSKYILGNRLRRNPLYEDSEDHFRTWYFPRYDDFTLMNLGSKFLIAAEEKKGRCREGSLGL
ncbi:hypothetical protein COP2_024094 [Malus domestica]